jgi:acyl-CoA thioesterase
METHPFDEAIRLSPAGEHRFAGATHPGYANMVGPFGGVTNALMLEAVLRHPRRLGDPVALTVNFAGPVADGAFEIEASPSRTNRSTQHWWITMRQGDAVVTTGTAVFAERRSAWSTCEPVMPAGLPRPSDMPRASAAGRPAWCARYDMRFADGAVTEFDGREHVDSLTRLWIRDDPPRPLDFASLAAIADNFLPRIFVRRRRLVPVGTVSMTTYFHADAALLDAQADRYVLGTARGLNFRSGYFDQIAEIWSDSGELLATSHQVVYYRE